MNRQNSPQKSSQKIHSPKINKQNENVNISNNELHDLATNDYKFENKIKQLNKQGVLLINQQKENQALPYLLQAERILQYAASCGRTIDRVLITTTLQNEACAYQRLWDLQKSSDYMQAIIYNIKTTLDCTPYIQFDITVKNEESQAYSDLTTFINKRIQAAFYYLQFSAVNSQINKHKLALESTRTALSILESICKECFKYQKIKKGKNSILMEDLISSFSFETQKPRGILAETKQALKSLQRHRQFFSFDTEVIENFTIGEVMQINTITIEQALKKLKIDDQVNHLNIIYKVLYLSICYFVMGTELRLISKQKKQDQLKTALLELNTSKIYHLYAIKIVSTLAPCESKYLQHLVKSFKNHYEIDLYAEDFMTQQISKFDFDSIKEFEEIQIQKEQQKIQSETETHKICFQNTKFNTFQTQQFDIGSSRQRLQKNVHQKISKSPILKNKKKTLKKDQTVKSRAKLYSQKAQNIYIFPKKKISPIQPKSKEKNYETKFSRQNDPISSSRQKIKIQANPQKISRVKKIKQQYLMKENKNKKSMKGFSNYGNKSKESSVQPENRGKRNLNSKQKLIKFTKK